jgi:hypothetical protein
VNLHSSGDVDLFIPQDAHGQIDITSRGDIQIDTETVSDEVEDWSYFLKLSEDGPKISIDAGGDVLVSDKKWGDFDLSRDFMGVDRDWKHIETRWEKPDEPGVKDADVTDRINRRFTHEAIRKAEERIKMALTGIGLQADSIAPQTATGSAASGGISKEEYLIVLKMLEEKKITVEQADQLLEALGG